jgi:predicted metalloprotease with PDZ domain
VSHLPATSYRIVAADPNAHLFEVACTVRQPDPSGQRFRLPAWIPGSYLIREFARHFVSVRAECNGRPLPIRKESKDCWRAAPCNGSISVIAEVYANDLSVRTAYLDRTRGYFNGPAVFLLPEGRESAPCIVDIVAPREPDCARWQVATTLDREAAPPWGFGTYRASDYDALIDHPVEMSDFTRVAFEAGGVVHDVVITGRHGADVERLARDLRRICQWQIDLFDGAPNGRAPFPRYLFQVTAVGDGYGGLEHRSSTSLLCARRELPQPRVSEVTDDYRTFLGLASHEYFHAWNVKRIKPAAFVPYDLWRENYTRELWAFEGLTSYYDDLALVRSGVIGPESYLELLGRTITGVLRTPGRTAQSIGDSSFDAWIKYYRQDENTPNAVVSYYAKGALVGLALDLTLRRSGSSLDALMRALWERFGKAGVGVPEGAIAGIASEIAGRPLDDFFAAYVDGTDDPPLSDLLRDVGVTLSLRGAESTRDKGGTPPKAQRADARPRCSLGARWTGTSEIKLTHVYRGGAAERAGLAAGDILVAIDGLRATADALDAVLSDCAPCDGLAVHAFRRDELCTYEVALDRAPLDTAWLSLDAAADDAMRARRRLWLGA